MQWKMFICGIACLLGVMVIAAEAQEDRPGQCDTRVVLGGTDRNNPAVGDGNPTSADSLSQTRKYRFVDDGDSTVVPFRMKDYRLTILADVNGKNTFRFLLGTGKAGCVISKKAADKMKLESFGGSEVRGSAGNAATRLVKIDSLQIDNLVWYPRQFEVVDDDEKSKCIFNGFDGVLGYEFFQSFPVRVSFDWKRVVVFDEAKADPPRPGIPVDIDLRSRVAVREMILDGRALQVVIDLAAAERFALYKDWIWTKKYYEGKKYEPNQYDCVGIEGYWKVFGVFGKFSLKIGDLEITDSWTTVEERLKKSPDLVSASWMVIGHRLVEAQKQSPANGLVGVGIVENFNLFIDYPNSRMYFDKRKAE